jgi:ribosomal subunit interface protein
MQLPLEITFRNLDPSEALENNVREHATRLDRFFDHIMSCRVMVEAPHRHHQKGNLYHVRIDVTVPDGELVANREADLHHSYADPYVAIRDAFDKITRQLEEWSDRRQRQVKAHAAPPHGRISELDLERSFGRIVTPDGMDIYFHRNSLLSGEFGELHVGDEVRFALEEGEKGPQASSVTLIGKHHIPG